MTRDFVIDRRAAGELLSTLLDRILKGLAQEGTINLNTEAVGIDSTIVKVHPYGTGAQKKGGPQSIGKSRGGWTTKIHTVAAHDRTAITFSLSPRQAHDAPTGCELLAGVGPQPEKRFLVMDRAYEGNQTRQLALELGYTPVVPPKTNRKTPWDDNRQMYKRRNQVERLFPRLKRYRRIFSRYDKLDLIYIGFITLVLTTEAPRSVNRP